MIKFRYFVSYTYVDETRGFGNIIITRKDRIISLEDIRDLEYIIEDEPPKNNNVVILNWKLLGKVIS